MCRAGQSITPSKEQDPAKQNRASDLVSFPTFREPIVREIDVASLSSSDLEALKIEDPFMYYSIPQAKTALSHGKNVDVSDFTSELSDKSSISMVRRQRRLSTECHPDETLDDFFNDKEFMASSTKQISMPKKLSGSKKLDSDDLFDFLLASYESLICPMESDPDQEGKNAIY